MPPVADGGHALERSVRDDDEPVAEIIRDSAGIFRRVADNHVLLRNHLRPRAVVERIHDKVGPFALRIGQAEGGGAFRGGELRKNIVVGEIDAVIVWFRGLGLVGEPACALILVKDFAVGHRHQRELAVVVYPRARLMRLLEAANPVVGVAVGPAVAHSPGHGSPEVHSPRTGDCRIGVAGGEAVLGLRADQRAHIIRRGVHGLLRHGARRPEKGQRHRSNEYFKRIQFHLRSCYII